VNINVIEGAFAKRQPQGYKDVEVVKQYLNKLRARKGILFKSFRQKKLLYLITISLQDCKGIHRGKKNVLKVIYFPKGSSEFNAVEEC
jgi:hypothetical protein